MLQTLMITFREGLEAFLIIAISLIYLTQTNRRELIPAVRSGVAVALVLSALLGIVLARIGALSPFWEGIMALVAAASVIYCTVHMLRMGKFMRQEITSGFAKTLGESGRRAWLLAFLFSAFMVGREGIETATMIASLSTQAESPDMAIGGVIGIVLAGMLAWLWVKFGRRINLARFFQLTASSWWSLRSSWCSTHSTSSRKAARCHTSTMLTGISRPSHGRRKASTACGLVTPSASCR